MNDLLTTAGENLPTVAGFLLTIISLFVIAYVAQKIQKKREGTKERILNTRALVIIGMFSAVAAVLMLFEVPLPFAPSFYKFDFSEIPVMICAFAYGPVAGVMTEFLKIILKLIFKGTSTAFVGDLANFAVGCSYMLPASIIYSLNKKKKMALVGCIAGTLVMTVFGTAFNAVYLLPAFSKLFGMPMDVIIEMGSKVNPLVKGDIVSFVIACVAPLNLIKGTVVSVVTMLIYKPLSPLIKKSQAKS